MTTDFWVTFVSFLTLFISNECFFFFWQIYAKLLIWKKSNVDIFKGFLMMKNGPKFLPDFQIQNNHQFYMTSSIKVINVIKGCLILFFWFSYLIYNKIWLNLLTNDHHLSYISQNFGKKKKRLFQLLHTYIWFGLGLWKPTFKLECTQNWH